jgi:hypothetical protein
MIAARELQLDSINSDIISRTVASIEKLVAQMRTNPANVRFEDAAKVCSHYFGEPRQRRTSHRINRTPWPGDPRVNIQESKGGNAKDYQVRQIIAAIDKLET